ncbi:MAG: zf-HC2 domain-containing protein [Zoogloeaceae bacterium]|nr:zf-HC2 domain-containing protein [Zoogloeaceae bacterium]
MSAYRPINCESVVAHLLEYLDGELDAATLARIERHLAQCRECCSRAEFERALRHRLRDLGEPAAPERLTRRIRALLEAF